jgi:hypothetical protein
MTGAKEALYIMQHVPIPAEAVKVERALTRGDLALLLKGANATQRALLDYDLRSGRIALAGLTAEEARSITKVPRGYQCTMSGLDRHQRDRLRFGFAEISEFHNRRLPSNKAIVAYVKRAGANRVFATLDALTKPQAIA